MANSGIYWIDETFNFCVRLLYDIGAFLGISYEEIKARVFCVIWSITSLLLFAEVIRLRMKIGIKNQSQLHIKLCQDLCQLFNITYRKYRKYGHLYLN